MAALHQNPDRTITMARTLGLVTDNTTSDLQTIVDQLTDQQIDTMASRLLNQLGHPAAA